MVGLHHENLATFYGVCSSPSEFMLVTEYCIKGSLEVGVLHADDDLNVTKYINIIFKI